MPKLRQEPPTPRSSKSAHTPGPWTAEIDRNTSGWRAPEQVVCIKSGETMIAHFPTTFVEYPETDEENEANARLIAAAPDLLAACEAITFACEKSPPLDLVKNISKAGELARAAIAKATKVIEER